MITNICNDCGLECDSVTRDEGVGFYEYCGSKGCHHNYVEASSCCDATVIKGSNTVISTQDHIARKDHGKIKKGDKYRLFVIRCWKPYSSTWIVKKKVKL